MNLQSFAERLLWVSAVGTAAIVVVVNLLFALGVRADGAMAPNRRHSR